MRPTASPIFERLAKNKQDLILSAATDEFAEHGFHQASISRLVRKLSIAKGSIFQYFGSKEGLFEHLFSSYVEEFKKPLRALRAKEQSFFDHVRDIMLASLNFIEGHPKIFRTYLKVLYEENVPFRERIINRVKGYTQELLIPLIRDAQKQGEIRPDLDPELVLFMVDGMLGRLLQARTVPGLAQDIIFQDQQVARDWAVQLADVLHRGLAPLAPQEPQHPQE